MYLATSVKTASPLALALAGFATRPRSARSTRRTKSSPRWQSSASRGSATATNAHNQALRRALRRAPAVCGAQPTERRLCYCNICIESTE
ncbi:hypothetical protein T492DRAFT_912038 [Pavlovales sp. CCMP2436]|nr:hypothetical protein T492DRAFT_912038 [Pavlovales sp. CCMP2436]